jgi:hypothetical protein
MAEARSTAIRQSSPIGNLSRAMAPDLSMAAVVKFVTSTPHTGSTSGERDADLPIRALEARPHDCKIKHLNHRLKKRQNEAKMINLFKVQRCRVHPADRAQTRIPAEVMLDRNTLRRWFGPYRAADRRTPRNHSGFEPIIDPLTPTGSGGSSHSAPPVADDRFDRIGRDRFISCGMMIGQTKPIFFNLSNGLLDPLWIACHARHAVGRSSCHRIRRQRANSHLTGKSKYVSGNGSSTTVKCHHSLS